MSIQFVSFGGASLSKGILLACDKAPDSVKALAIGNGRSARNGELAVSTYDHLGSVVAQALDRATLTIAECALERELGTAKRLV